jgi:hypothetical protein
MEHLHEPFRNHFRWLYGFGQVIASPDFGETWTPVLNQPEMRIVHSIVADEDGYIIYNRHICTVSSRRIAFENERYSTL